MSNKLIQIEVAKLYPHPKNPRLDVGDVTELAESIKAKGILQNLTVVSGGPGVPDGVDGFTVIIGHRRRAGAIEAGIKEVPCAVVEMDEKEQVSTMLLENMQRSDLTIYEQAQGIQMMLDLGSTVKDISEKTGFSVSTIDRRRKLLTLDKEKFCESQGKNATLEDYLKVSEIEDEKERNSVLGYIGTNNFEYQLRNAIENQRKKKVKEYILSFVPESVIKVTSYSNLPNWDERVSIMSFMLYNKPDKSKLEELKEKLSEEGSYYVYDNGYNIEVYKKVAAKKAKDSTESNNEYIKKREEIQKRVDGLKAIGETAFDLRKEFFENLKVTKENQEKVLKFCFMAISNDTSFEYEVRELCRLMEVDFYSEEEIDELDENCDFDYYGYEEEKKKECADKNVKQAIYFQSYLSLEDYNCSSFYSYNAEYYESSFLIRIYKLLAILGYQISDEEQKYIDGTHELFMKEQNDD